MKTELRELYLYTKNEFKEELKQITPDCVSPIIAVRTIVKEAILKYCYPENGENVFSSEDFQEVTYKICRELTFTLKPIFKNLVEFSGTPEFKTEWNEQDFKNVNKALRKLFVANVLQDHRGAFKTIRCTQDIEYFFGLPYTSSSNYAMIGNTNTVYHIDTEENYNIELFAITTDNKIIMEVWDNEENEKYFILGGF